MKTITPKQVLAFQPCRAWRGERLEEVFRSFHNHHGNREVTALDVVTFEHHYLFPRTRLWLLFEMLQHTPVAQLRTFTGAIAWRIRETIDSLSKIENLPGNDTDVAQRCYDLLSIIEAQKGPCDGETMDNFNRLYNDLCHCTWTISKSDRDACTVNPSWHAWIDVRVAISELWEAVAIDKYFAEGFDYALSADAETRTHLHYITQEGNTTFRRIGKQQEHELAKFIANFLMTTEENNENT